jgi:transposase-like protein/IS1 family transposase
MVCHNCKIDAGRHGRDRYGHQRYKCRQCSHTFQDARDKPLDGMYLNLDKAEMILKMLCEGVSIRSIERLTEIHRDTVLRLLVVAGEKCERILGQKIRNVPVQDVQLDEIWGFCFKKQKQLRPGDDPSFGDAWCFTAIERHSKLVLNFALGKRDQATTNAFIEGLRLATAPQPYQLTADGFGSYPFAIENTLGDRCDFAQLIKVYRATPEGERRYSPAEVVSTERVPVIGEPDPKRICTSHVERQNLTMRMQMRRLTRLTNGFSKKWENHWAAVIVWFTFYNFCRVHKSLRVTPAMAADISDHVWSVRELLEAA